MKDKVITFRCSEFFYNQLVYWSKYFNISQSDVLEVLLFAFNDYTLAGHENDKFYKYIVKQLDRK